MRIAGTPAPERGHHIIRRDRRAIMEGQSIAQRKPPDQRIVRDGIGIHHLRLRPLFRVPAK
jgi:hypothetical protein